MNIEERMLKYEESLRNLRNSLEALKMRLVDMDKKIHKLKERE